MTIATRILVFNMALASLLAAATVRAASISMQEEEQALAQIYGNQEMISIATGTKQPIGKAPAVATVITAEDIKAIGATEQPIGDYGAVDFTVRRTHLADHWDIAFSVRNLFDADIREPSPFGATAASIPNDFPQAGRSVFGEIRVNF